MSPSFVDLTGRKFGQLTVLEMGGYASGHKIVWRCVCDCGNLTDVRCDRLKNGKTQSCGCYRTTSLAGKVFGRLTAISISRRDFKGQAYWKCLCECGNKPIVRIGHLTSGRTKSCGCLNDSWMASQVKEYFTKYYEGISEYKVIRNPKTGRWIPFDMYLPSENVFIEIHGIQHYKITPPFQKSLSQFETRKYIDKYKKKFAQTNGTYIEIDTRIIKTPEEAIIFIEQRL